MPGRDAFIEILRKNGLMVHIRRRRRYKTTDSNHHYRKYPNLIKDVVPHRPNEIWVSDITYIETDEGVCYLSLITDAYSHKDRRLGSRFHPGDHIPSRGPWNGIGYD